MNAPDYTDRTLGNWRLTRPLGEGSFGAVYQADNLVITGRQAAVKVLHPHMAVNEDFKRRFLNEASAASRADHENIVQIFDGGITGDGICYVVMEFLHGSTLHSLTADRRLPVGRACHIGGQIAAAMQAAHERGIVHRDLKPDNIMIVSRPRSPDFVKVLDFGIAKLLHGGAGTAFGVVMGTAHYMPPEQWQALHDIDGRADIYSLGVILFRCLTGQRPFEAHTQYEWQVAHLSAPIPDPATLVPMPSWLGLLVMKMMAKDRADRPQTMAEVRDALIDGMAATSPDPVVPAPRPAAMGTLTSAPDQPSSSSVSRKNGEYIRRAVQGRRPLLLWSGATSLCLLTIGVVVLQRRGEKAGLALAPVPAMERAQHSESRPAQTHTETAKPAIPPGMIELGPGELPAHNDTGPPRKVARFAIDKRQVSFLSYREYNVSKKRADSAERGVDFNKDGDQPAVLHPQREAEDYCGWRYPDQRGRLPTRTELDYAARGHPEFAGTDSDWTAEGVAWRPGRARTVDIGRPYPDVGFRCTFSMP